MNNISALNKYILNVIINNKQLNSFEIAIPFITRN